MNKRITIYEDLINQAEFTKAWKSEECFKYDGDSELKDKLQELIGIEISFERFSVEEDYLSLYKELESYLTEGLLPNFDSDIFLFHMEYQAMPKSKIRSFKGLTKARKVFANNDFIEKEITVSNESSLFASVIKVNKANYKLIFEDYLYDSERSFLLISKSKNQIYSESFLSEMVFSSVNSKGLTYVNYLPLSIHYCFGGAIIIRIGGDGNTQTSIQIFAHRSKLSYLEIIIDLMDEKLI